MQLIQAFHILSVAALLTVGLGKIPDGATTGPTSPGIIPDIEAGTLDMASLNDSKFLRYSNPRKTG